MILHSSTMEPKEAQKKVMKWRMRDESPEWIGFMKEYSIDSVELVPC